MIQSDSGEEKPKSFTAACLPFRRTQTAEFSAELLGEFSDQLPAHHPAVILQPSLVSDPLPHLEQPFAKLKAVLQN